ncbi:DMT family transporter [Tellurirhabdus rosea]|uniref:DMT family transporter n=1 Tax=Tellurirhabdus rosea TaxID=2674997 RepID=UPI00225B85E2|nr:DMT family transporter [Tellurirhabdus rosea]
MSNQLLYILLAVGAGAMIPFQSAMNTQLGKSLQSPYFSALTVFVVAAVGLGIYNAVTQQALPATSRFAEAPGWSYVGGVLGGAYILLIVICAPRLGIGNVTLMVLLGQVLAALLIDQFGLLNAPVHVITWQRLAGVLLVVAGVYIVRTY